MGRPTVRRAGRLTLKALLAVGRSLEEEQDNVMRVRLVEEYMRGVKGSGSKASDTLDAARAAERARRGAYHPFTPFLLSFTRLYTTP